MKLAGKVISFLIISIFVTFLISGCIFPSKITVTSIEVDQTTITEVYDVEEFTPTNIQINVTWSDDSVTQIALTDTMVSAETLELFQISGEHLITVAYEGQTTSFVLKLSDYYSVNFDSNGGTTNVNVIPGVKHGTSISLPAPTKAGFEFLGWYTSNGLNAALFDEESVVTSNLTLYAKWEEEDDTIGIDDILDKVITIDLAVRSGAIAEELVTLAAEFKSLYPNITINVEAISGTYDSIHMQILLDILSDNAPDLVIGYPDHLAEFFSNGALVNLSVFIENEEYGFTEAELNDFVGSFLYENRGFDPEFPEDLYGLPFYKSTEVLIYNQTFFEGLYGEAWETKIPKTWQEFEVIGADILTRVANKEADDIFVESINPTTQEKTYLKLSDYLINDQFYPLVYDSTENAFITLSSQFEGAYTERIDAESGYVRFDNPQTIAALNYFKDLNDAGLFGTAATFDENYCCDVMKTINSVMTIGSTAGIGFNADTDSPYDYELGVAPIPYYAADKKLVIQQGTSLGMLNQNTEEEKLAAWLFIKFLMEPAQTARFNMAIGGYLPVRQSAFALTAYEEYLTSPTENQKYFSLAANVVLNCYMEEDYQFIIEEAFVGSAEIRNEVGSIFQAIIVNNEDIQTRIDEAYLSLRPFVE
jgi:multiple sugar transport system substrate-binding protein